jgi:tryptophanase
MKILIWTGHHDLLDAAIKFFTHGKGSHAAFLRADGRTIHEAFFPRVRDRLITAADYANAECYELAGVTRAQHGQFERLFDANLRKGIDYCVADLFRYAFNRPCRSKQHTFCSRYVLQCCRAVLADNQLPLVRIPGGDWASPRDLRISPRLYPVPLKAPL